MGVMYIIMLSIMMCDFFCPLHISTAFNVVFPNLGRVGLIVGINIIKIFMYVTNYLKNYVFNYMAITNVIV